MNTFGNTFRVHIFGESHGPLVGITVDGCPPGISIKDEDFIHDIERRKSGAKGTTPRVESDTPRFVTGIFNGKTTGAPLTIIFENQNTRSKDYTKLRDWPRPGHADFVAFSKYKGFNDYRGGGHFSGRLTLPLVAAGVLAKKIIDPVQIEAKLIEAYGMKDIQKAIDKAVEMKDSIGGIVACTATRMPVGLGEPFFNAVESLISHAVFAIPAIKGIAFGSGFDATKMTGAEHNDPIIDELGRTESNNAGGINGGISNGNDLVFKVAVKPTSSTPKEQASFSMEKKKMEKLIIEGRHDLCIALRVPVVVEAVTAIVLADLLLLQNT